MGAIEPFTLQELEVPQQQSLPHEPQLGSKLDAPCVILVPNPVPCANEADLWPSAFLGVFFLLWKL